MKKNGRPEGAPCPYCVRPEIFETPADEPAESRGPSATVHLLGPYWRRQLDKPFPALRSFPERLYKDGQRRFTIGGAKNFKSPYNGFDVEVVGLPFPFRPIHSAGPGFHSLGPNRPGNDATVIHYNAARITHRATGVTANAHAWETHGLLVSIKHLPTNPTGEAIEAARRLLGFFTLDYRGRPKITSELILLAFDKLGPDAATQSAVARELGVTRQALVVWGRREGLKKWEDFRRRYIYPYPPPKMVAVK